MFAPVLVSVLALSADLGIWEMQEARLQAAADAAAVSAAYLLSNSSATQAQFRAAVTSAVSDASGGGWGLGTLGSPQVNVGAGGTSLTVVLTSQASTFFFPLFNSHPVMLSASSTAGSSSPPVCLLALSPTAAQGIFIGDSGNSVSATGCAIFSDSTASPNCASVNQQSTSSLNIQNATVTAASIGAAGSACVGSGNQVTPAPVSNATPVANPYAGVQAPSVAAQPSCPANAPVTQINSSGTVAAGTYCGGIYIGSGVTVTLSGTYNIVSGGLGLGSGAKATMSGTYNIYGGGVSFGGGGQLTLNNVVFNVLGSSFTMNDVDVCQGSGVGVYLGRLGSTAPGSVNWNQVASCSGQAATITAPTSGALAGFLVYQGASQQGDPADGASGMAGGSVISFSGAIYLPRDQFRVQGGSNASYVANGPTFSIVADTIEIGVDSANVTVGSTSGASSSSSSGVMLLN